MTQNHLKLCCLCYADLKVKTAFINMGGGGGGGQPNFCVCPGKKSQNTHTQKLTKTHMEF